MSLSAAKNLSLSSPVNWLFFSAVLVFWILAPGLTAAKTVEFESSTWTVNPIVADSITALPIRAGSLRALTRLEILGADENHPAVLLHKTTLEELENITHEITQPPKSAKLVVENDRAKEFEPGQDGRAVDLYQFYQQLLASNEQITLPVIISRPGITLGQTNDLGITELIAVGESDFSGSPYNRIVNIRVGANKFNGLIIPPQAEFSFNKFLGDVDEANGFLPELVIKKDGLVPELGGGLCQVSSTTFRAAMNAGLPILERRNHSFPVRYYAPQGTDATIYPGVTDFRFTNDLSSHLLIRTRIAGPKLFFEFYGTKDNRQVVFDGPVQYDKKPDGSMKATWSRSVTLNGEKKEQTFRSVYLSPDLFKKTAVAESNIPNPTANPPATPPAETPPATN